MALFDPEPTEIKKGILGDMFDRTCKGCAIEESISYRKECPWRREHYAEYVEQACYCCDDHRELCERAYYD